MIYSILIGYKYSGTSYELPGIDIDLYRVFNYCHENLNIPLDNIKVITDIKELNNIPCNQYLCPEDNMKIFMDILDSLADCMKCESIKIFLYYSGHGVIINGKQNIILPGGLYLNEDDLYHCLQKFRRDVEILSIIDSCHRSIVSLPYSLSEKNTETNNKEYGYQAKIICLSSSTQHEKSTSSVVGSFFTEAIIDYLSKNNDNRLTEIRKNVRVMTQVFNQTAMVTISHPELTHLWPWAQRNKDVCLL